MSSFYSDQIVPRMTHWILSRPSFTELRASALATAKGRVLEIGFGSGLNLPFYPSGIECLIALEPSQVARAIAAPTIKQCPFPIEFIGLTGEALPLDDASVDYVVTTWTLCSIPDGAKALREIRRVLRPGGKYLFIEHGRAPDPAVAKWQDRLTPFQKRLAGGCHLNRPIEELIIGAGFEIESLRKFYNPGPRPGSYTYLGVAS